MSRSAPPSLLLSTSPFLKHEVDTAWIMWQVNLSLVPVVLLATYLFGLGALLTVAACTAGAMLPEIVVQVRGGAIAGRVRDGSAVITGVLLALTLPPGLPLWMAFTGGVIAVVVGKQLFGGIGANLFNPALVGRVFLQAAFPAAMTTWLSTDAPRDLFAMRGHLFAPPFGRSTVEAVTSATPLAQMKFEGQATALPDLLFGGTGGSLGETGALLLLACGLYLAARRVINWRIPVAVFAGTALLSGALHLIDPAAYAPPLFHLFSGGLMLGAVYMATDPVTSPITQRGCWVFGLGIGVLVVVIRTFGGLPEGVMYAILLMNAATPLINRITPARVYGTGRRAAKAATT